MTGDQVDNTSPWHKRKAWQVGLLLASIVAFVVISNGLQTEVGIPFDTTYRVACAAICLIFIYGLGSDFPGQRSVRISFWICLLVNSGIFFTPLVDRPASRGELMLFALPDAVVTLTILIALYRPADVHQRATRQTMILALIVALVFCVGLFVLTLMQVHHAFRPNR